MLGGNVMSRVENDQDLFIYFQSIIYLHAMSTVCTMQGNSIGCRLEFFVILNI